MFWFALVSGVGFCATVVTMLLRRGRRFATFVGVLLGFYSVIAAQMAPPPGPLLYGFIALHATVYAHWVRLSWPRMPRLPFLLLLSWPSALMFSGTLLSWPWAILLALGFHPWAPWLPYVLGAVGMFQSLSTRREVVDLVVAGPSGTSAPQLLPHPHGTHREERPLRIVQITDPHLGSFMSVARLRRIASRAVKAAPDLIFLTGDFLTLESQRDPDLLLRALEPLKELAGKTFACFGNHDHEAPEIVRRALRENGVQLLVDAEADVETPVGRVQVVGMDFVRAGRSEHLARVSAAHPRNGAVLRVVLLHDPGAFQHLPEGTADLVLAGHTHGGQVGLLSLGLPFTILRTFGLRLPDHGFWARGTDRMYVHRGTGHYGFPVRVGVPAEESVVRIHREPPRA